MKFTIGQVDCSYDAVQKELPSQGSVKVDVSINGDLVVSRTYDCDSENIIDLLKNDRSHFVDMLNVWTKKAGDGDKLKW